MEQVKLSIIGGGNMATAILGGVLRQKLFTPEEVCVSDRDEGKRAELAAQGLWVTPCNRTAAQAAPLVLLAVKPQVLDAVLEDLDGVMAGRCLVSIIAGVSTDYLRRRLPGVLAVRVMPNTPLLVGLGATAIAQTDDVPAEQFALVRQMFEAAGTVAVLPEAQMNAVIGVNGSSPAYFFRMASAMVAEAVRQGIDRDLALHLTAATMEGAANMLLQSGKTPEELTRQVCSPGGTTLAALTAFDDLGYDALMAEAMTRCTRRAGELGK